MSDIVTKEILEEKHYAAIQEAGRKLSELNKFCSENDLLMLATVKGGVSKLISLSPPENIDTLYGMLRELQHRFDSQMYDNINYATRTREQMEEAEEKMFTPSNGLMH